MAAMSVAWRPALALLLVLLQSLQKGKLFMAFRASRGQPYRFLWNLVFFHLSNVVCFHSPLNVPGIFPFQTTKQKTHNASPGVSKGKEICKRNNLHTFPDTSTLG